MVIPVRKGIISLQKEQWLHWLQIIDYLPLLFPHFACLLMSTSLCSSSLIQSVQKKLLLTMVQNCVHLSITENNIRGTAYMYMYMLTTVRYFMVLKFIFIFFYFKQNFIHYNKPQDSSSWGLTSTTYVRLSMYV